MSRPGWFVSVAAALLGIALYLRAYPALALPLGMYLLIRLRPPSKSGLRRELPAALWMTLAIGTFFIAGAAFSEVAVAAAAVSIAIGVLFAAAEFLSHRSRSMALQILVVLALLIPLTVVSCFAPFRAAAILLDALLPDAVPELVAAAPAGGLPEVDRRDRAFATVAFFVMGLLFFRERRWLAIQRNQLENLPTSRPSSVALGLVEVEGRARRREDATGGPALSADRPAPFYVEDDRGRVLVDPKHMSGSGESFSLVEMLRLELKALSLSKGAIGDGEPVYVVGTAELGDDGGTSIVIRPRSRPLPAPRRWWSAATREVVKWFIGSPKGSSDYLEAFFVSDSGQEGARRHMDRMARRVAAIGLTAVGLCAFMAMTRHFRLQPPDLVLDEPVFSRPEVPAGLVEAVRYTLHEHPDYRLAGEKRLADFPVDTLSPEILLELLRSRLPAARDSAARGLAKKELGPEHLPAFSRATEDFVESGPRLQALVLRKLASLGIAPQEAREWFTAGVESTDAGVRRAVLDGADTYGEAGGALAPLLVDALVSWDPEFFQAEKGTEQQLAASLVRWGEDAEAPLEKAVESEPEPVAERAADLLLLLTRAPDELIQRLERYLGDPRVGVRRGALHGFARNEAAFPPAALSRIGDRVRPHLHEDDHWTRRYAIDALSKTGGGGLDERDLDVLLDALSASYYERYSSMKALASSRASRSLLTERLFEIYRKVEDLHVRVFALESLVGLEPPPPGTDEILVDALESRIQLLSDAAVAAIAKLPSASPELIAGMTTAPVYGDRKVELLKSLGRFEAWEALLEMYRANDSMRGNVLHALAEGASTYASALPFAVTVLELSNGSELMTLLRGISSQGHRARPYSGRIRAILREREMTGANSLLVEYLSALEAPPPKRSADDVVLEVKEPSGKRSFAKALSLSDGYRMSFSLRSTDTTADRRVMAEVLSSDLFTIFASSRGVSFVFPMHPTPEPSFDKTARIEAPGVLGDGAWHRFDAIHDAARRELRVVVDGEPLEVVPSYKYGGMTEHPEGGQDILLRWAPTELTFLQRGSEAREWPGSVADLLLFDGPGPDSPP